MRNKYFPAAFMLLFIAVFTQILNAQNIVFPSDAGVIDITQPPYNADNTGQVDATSIIQQAVDDVTPGYYKFIYFPSGTYLVSDRIIWGTGGWIQGPVLIGQDRDETVIRLADSAVGFEEGERRGVFLTGMLPAQRFNTGFRNLTINIGSNNPGACGVQYMANNEGMMDNVLITSDDGGGRFGLDMGYTDEIGPLLIRNVEIEGFDVGIQIEKSVNSMTLSDIRITGQKQFGIYIDNQVVSIEGLVSNNSVTAVHAYRGELSLINSSLLGGASDQPAIINGFGGYLFARNITTDGYGQSIKGFGGNAIDYNDSYVKEYVSHDVLKLFDESAHRSLDLPVAKSPFIDWETNLSNWVNVEDYGAVAGDGIDDTEAFQKAIDACTAESGITTVYIPNRTIPTNDGSRPFTIKGTLLVNNNLKNFMGCAGYIDGDGRLVIQDGSQDVVKIQNLRRLRVSDFGIEHQSSKTLIIEASVLSHVIGRGTGNLFVNDVVTRYLDLNNPDQQVWCRQLNMEDKDLDPPVRITNNGSQLWVFGYKTEENGLKGYTLNNGKSEFIGYFNYPISSEKLHPIFKVENAQFSLAGMRQSSSGVRYNDYIEEIRGTDKRILTIEDTHTRRIPLFTAYTDPNQVNYTITASADIGGVIDPSGQIVAAEGSSQRFLITANDGYEIGDVTVDGESMGNLPEYVFTNVDSDHTIAAYFTLVSDSPERVELPGLVWIFPNPAEKILNIHCVNAVEPLKMTIFDSRGSQVYDDLVSGQTTMDISFLKSGVYIFSFKSAKSRQLATINIL